MRTPYSNSDEWCVGWPVFQFELAADDPVGAIPDLHPVIHDFERNRAKQKKRQENKRSELPHEQPQLPKSPDSEHQIDDYA